MKQSLWTSVATAIAVLVALAPAAHGAEEPTRESFVAQAEPICERSTRLVKGILEGAKEKVDDDRLPPAGRQFIRASAAFGSAIQQIAAIPRPPADDARLLKWLKFLRIVKTRVANIGKALREEDRIRAEHESIRAEQSGNATNNVGFVFEFRSCRLTRSQFR
ncbi:MAG TPA: hypothetical protein VIE64_08790 [Solirubrobacterales bacterium]|jgi:ribosomal 50S subunit-recycling heat shock protein